MCGGRSRREGDIQRTCPADSTSPGVSLNSSNTQVTPPDRSGTFTTFTLNYRAEEIERERERERERAREKEQKRESAREREVRDCNVNVINLQSG